MNPKHQSITLIQIYAISAIVVGCIVTLGCLVFAVYILSLAVIVEVGAFVLDTEPRDSFVNVTMVCFWSSLILGFFSTIFCIGCAGMLFRRRWGRILAIVMQVLLLVFSSFLITLLINEIVNHDLVITFTHLPEFAFLLPLFMLIWSVWGLPLLARKRAAAYFEPQIIG
jgi:hypothetical protein